MNHRQFLILQFSLPARLCAWAIVIGMATTASWPRAILVSLSILLSDAIIVIPLLHFVGRRNGEASDHNPEI